MVNHSKYYKDPISQVCTNMVEGMWGRVKLSLKRHKGVKRETLAQYIDEWMFRQQFVKKSNQSPLIVIAKAVGAFYNPKWKHNT